MANDDDIERLLREVAALEGGGGTGKANTPAIEAGRAVAKVPDAGSSGSSRAKWAVLSAAGGGATGLVVGTFLAFLPAVDSFSTAIGAALGAAIAGFVSGPPGWFKK